MADSDIPIAYGTPLPPPQMAPAASAPVGGYGYGHAVSGANDNNSSSQLPARDLRTATNINGGGSSRVNLPTGGQEAHRLSAGDLQALHEQGYTDGLARSLSKNKLALPLSIWVVDNSGSMATRDGHRLVSVSKHSHALKAIDCTRWTEMQETVQYHAQMAALLHSPTIFRLLNDPGRVVGPQQFSVAERGEQQVLLDEDLAIATSTMQNGSPGGVTPLVRHVREIRENIVMLLDQLRKSGTKMVVVLATDGIPTDEQGYSNDTVKREFVQALRSLEGLPVWIVVRLCTDEDSVVDYWNDLDSHLELSLEVLDDFESEAKEIYEHNKWLNYGLPIHRMREAGFYNRLFDLLDERPLAKDEVRDFMRILFGDDSGLPDPEAEWDDFVKAIERLNGREKQQWNPITHRMEHWINVKQLKRAYAPGWFSSIW